MAIPIGALNAYNTALAQARSIDGKVASSLIKTPKPQESFSKTMNDSLKNVNDLQEQKNDMIESFAAGETQNVHELMINLQKAGLAMSLTSAVRGKVLETYKELIKMPF